jgi:hypothetical protein
MAQATVRQLMQRILDFTNNYSRMPRTLDSRTFTAMQLQEATADLSIAVNNLAAIVMLLSDRAGDEFNDCKTAVTIFCPLKEQNLTEHVPGTPPTS